MSSPPLYPLMFQPRFKARLWGGRALETLYDKPLPPDIAIGESWEISDRPGDESVIVNGPLAARTLRSVMEEHAAAILGGAAAAEQGRLPLLCKILDAREKLSLQVHPPPHATRLGDPKTEMWYIAAAEPGAELYVGLKAGVTRRRFEEAIERRTVADCFHRVAVAAGDAMFLPSGRVHAIGAGLVIFEIQQNSDTTFRVHDWDRVDADGRPRELHIPQSLESIDFTDFEPALISAEPVRQGHVTVRSLVDHALFRIDLLSSTAVGEWRLRDSHLQVVACVDGPITVRCAGASETLAAGGFCLIPASVPNATIASDAGAKCLVVEAGC